MKNFAIFKNEYKKEGSTQPDYKIMVTLREGEKMTDAGGCWLKDGKSGKYFSCKLSDAFVDHTKGIARKGFTLTIDESNGNDMPDMPEEKPEDDIPF